MTKVDLVDDPDWLDLVEMDIQDTLAGTLLAGAPVVRVSAMTGYGLPELRRTLAQLLADLPPRRNRARPRLPIDRDLQSERVGHRRHRHPERRAVSCRRHGGSAARRPIQARIRGLQTHNGKSGSGEPGSRLAINLSGVSTEEVHRGDVVARPGTFQPTTLIDVRFRLLADAPKALAHNQRVDLFTGASEIRAYARVLGAEQIEPGQEGWLQLRLDHPVVVVAGDRFILRQPSPSLTLGGGEVLSPTPRRRWRRFDPAVLARLQTLSRGTPDAILLHTLARNPLISPQDLIRRSELEQEAAQSALDELRTTGALRECLPTATSCSSPTTRGLTWCVNWSSCLPPFIARRLCGAACPGARCAAASKPCCRPAS